MYPRNSAGCAVVIGMRHCVPAECGLFLCGHVYSVEDTASRFQPTIHCHNSESRKHPAVPFHSPHSHQRRKALAFGFVWPKLSLTGAELRLIKLKKAVPFPFNLQFYSIHCVFGGTGDVIQVHIQRLHKSGCNRHQQQTLL